MATIYTTTMSSPLGPLGLRSDGRALISVTIGSDGEDTGPCEGVLERARAELERYFAGSLRELDLPLAPAFGSPFQREVWRALVAIPYGTTLSYGELARRIGRPGAARAVGRANATNPLAIVVPCHRVIGQDGSLTGYAGGMEIKRWLLQHEARVAQGLGIQISELRSSAVPVPPS